MIFDLFHSMSDPLIKGKCLGASRVFSQFMDQVQLAEGLGFDTVWCAESHFSSEIQKQTSVATIPHFAGEVGLNCDSFQLAHYFLSQTKRIGFGTAIHNIVGGSGGPIASAERVRFLDFCNEKFLGGERYLRIGVAAGRFPYQNTPFQFVPRDSWEEENWGLVKRYHFIEALEIFLRLLSGESLSSEDVQNWECEGKDGKIRKISPRWTFEKLKLIPFEKVSSKLEIVLGSHDPLALDWGLNFWDLSVFNLSFTSPEQIEALQKKMAETAEKKGRKWIRSRLPRTVMVFIDNDRKKAYRLADEVLTTYVEAMRNTAQVPEKEVLLKRALVGDPSEIKEQLYQDPTRGFHSSDRLLLWFEFNQTDNEDICQQMKLFKEKVMAP